MDDPETKETALFLWKTANMLSTTCPAASRYYMSTLSKHGGCQMISQSFKKTNKYCKHCGSFWNHLNHKIRIQPIPSPNCHVRKLIKWEKEQPWKLNHQQKKKLKKYRESTNKIIYTCDVCKKSTKFDGLKKYRVKEQDMSMNTPVPKIKPKKGDLNAGLFIKTPVESLSQNKLMLHNQDNKSQNAEASFQTPIPKSTDTSNVNNRLQTERKPPLTSKFMQKNETLPILSSSKKKRKKGLLAQIINQEQEAKRQKKTLSSFLTSL